MSAMDDKIANLKAERSYAINSKIDTYTDKEAAYAEDIFTNEFLHGDTGPAFYENIFQATINLVSDPEDLTTANWTNVNSSDALSDLYYDGKRFTKITNVGANQGYVSQDLTDTWTTLTPSFSVIMKKGASTGNITRCIIYNLAPVNADVFDIIMDWDNYPNAPGAPTDGILHDYKWKDSETLEIKIICSALANLTDNLRICCYGSNNATDGEYTYWTAVQAEDLPYPTPYVNGSRSATHLDETFEMPSKFIVDTVFRPWFAYDVSINNMSIFAWFADTTHKCHIYYEETGDFYRLVWWDGGTVQYMDSQVFDDGTSHTDINQRLRIIASIDLTTGDTTGSRFIIIPLESGAKFEDTSWRGNIDAHSSTLSTLSIGHVNDEHQIDSEIEYLRIYKDTLVGTVDNSDDADALLAEKELLFNYEEKDIGIQDLLKLYYEEKNFEKGTVYSWPKLEDYGDTGWEEIYTSAISVYGDKINGFYPPDQYGYGALVMNKETPYLEKNGESVGTTGLLAFIDAVDNAIGDSASAVGDARHVSGYNYGSSVAAEAAGDAVAATEDGSGLRGKRTKNSTVTTQQDPGVGDSWRYTVGSGGTDTPNYYSDPEKAALLTVITNLTTSIDFGDSYRNKLEEIRTEITKIKNNENNLFNESNIVSYVSDDGDSINDYASELNTFVGSNRDSYSGDTTLWGFYNYYGDTLGTATNFDTYLTHLETFIGTITTRVTTRHDSITGKIGDTITSNNLKKARYFWIEQRIGKPMATFINYTGMDDAITIAEDKLIDIDERLEFLVNTPDNYIPIPEIYVVYNDPRYDDNEVIEDNRVSVVWSGQRHATDYKIYRKEVSQDVYNFESGLMRLYHLDNNVNDSSSNLQHGTQSGGSFVTGVSNQAWNSDGDSNYITIPQILQNPLTISCWYKGTESGSWRTLFCRDGGAYHHLLIQGATKKIGFYNSSWFSSGKTINDNQLYHIAVTINGTNWSLYIDGKLITTISGMFDTATYPLDIMGNYNSSSPIQNINGWIDEIRIYNRILATEEIEYLYQDPTIETKRNNFTNTAWGDTYLLTTWTALDEDTGVISTQYTDASISLSKKYIYRIKITDDTNDSFTSRSNQSNIFEDGDTVISIGDTTNGSKIEFGDSYSLKKGEYVLLRLDTKTSGDGFYYIERANNTNIIVSPKVHIKNTDTGVIYKVASAIFM